MNASDRYFMAVVDLIQARDRLSHIIEGVQKDQLVPSVELMSASAKQIMDAMIKTEREFRHDPRFKVEKLCGCGCGRPAEFAGYQGCV